MRKALAAALLVLALALVGGDVRDNENNKFHSEFKSSPSEISYWKKGMGWMKCVMFSFLFNPMLMERNIFYKIYNDH